MIPIANRKTMKSLEHSDPGRILTLCTSLVDNACSLLQTKINVFIQDESSSELVLQVVVHNSSRESHVEAVGSHTLLNKKKIYLPDKYLKMLERSLPSSVLMSEVDAQFEQIITPYLASETTKRRRLVIVPVAGRQFSLLVLLTRTSAATLTEEDLFKLVSETFTFVWPTLQKSIEYEHERFLKQKCQQLLRVARRLFMKVGSLPSLLHMVMKEARRLTRAEACSVLLIDLDSNQLVESYFESSDGDKESVTTAAPGEQRLFPLDAGVAGHVLITGTLRNVRRPKDDQLFLRTVDERPGITTVNLLCFPIRDDSGIIGVGQLFNKMAEPCFDISDEEMALAFSEFCGVCVAHSLVYRRVEESYVRSALAYEIMMYHMKVSDDEVKRVGECPTRHTNPHLASLHLNVRALPPPELPCYVLQMFSHLGYMEKFKINREKLVQFVLYAQRGYRDVPYHNWQHAFSVAQFAYAAILNWRLTQDGYLSELQCLMYLIASLVHDLDHRGTTNGFHVAGNLLKWGVLGSPETALAALYSSAGSVMERHHLSQAMCILNTEGCDVLSGLPRGDYDKALLMLRDYILATDLANYFKKCGEYRHIAEDGYVKSSCVHTTALMCLLMNAADLCDQIKDWSSVKRTAASVLAEFFSQGDIEKSLGELPLPMMDRDVTFIPDLEINFITNISIPLFQVLGRIIPGADKETVQIMKNHIERWEASKPTFAEVDTNAGLAVLLSAELDGLIEANLNARRAAPSEPEKEETECEE